LIAVLGLGACTGLTGSNNTTTSSLSSRIGYDAVRIWPDTTAEKQAEMNDVVDLGAGWVKGDFNWPSIERTRGRFTWDATDTIVNLANSRGLRVMAGITSTPGWAGNGLPTNNADYGAFAGAVARRYAPRGVHTYEIWNEANLRGPWPAPGAPDIGKYTGMLKAAYVAIHQADPQATVITSGTAPAGDVAGYSWRPSTFVRGIYDHGGGGYFDAVGMHPHTTPSPANTEQAWNPIVQARDEVYPLMRSRGDGGKKIWATEAGFTTSGSVGVSESLQGSRLIGLVQTWLSYPWAGPLFLYQLNDGGSDPSNWHDHFGLLRTDGSRKPAYAQLRSYLRSH